MDTSFLIEIGVDPQKWQELKKNFTTVEKK